MIEADTRGAFDALARRLTSRAARIAQARALRRALARKADARRWRRAGLLWPLFSTE